MPALEISKSVKPIEDEDQIDFSDLEKKYSVEMDSKFDSVVVISNLPIVTTEKEEKLINVIKKIFKGIGTTIEGGLWMPKDSATGKSKGYLFMEFQTPAMAANAVKVGDGYRLDKSHVLSVNYFDDIEKYWNLEEEYVEPTVEEYVPKEHLKSWLEDEKARDQFVLFKGDTVGVYYNNKSKSPELVHKRDNWTDTFVGFSPHGLYLATVHKQGIALWGGKSWSKISRFVHPNVKLFDFSPNEQYLTTFSYEPFKTDGGESQVGFKIHDENSVSHEDLSEYITSGYQNCPNLCVWHIASGRLLRSFNVDQTSHSSSQQSDDSVKVDWPIFKWSNDEKYVAKIIKGAEGMIQVYETPGMGLLDKKSIKVENIVDMEWSPKEHIISYWTPEKGNIPARVTLMSIPNRQIIRTKNLFGVLDCKLYWQSNGDYLLVKVDRAKSKKQTTTSFELYSIHGKDVPVDVFEVGANEQINGVFWEPLGQRFIVLANDGSKSLAHFYEISQKKSKAPGVESMDINITKTIDSKGINHVSWSPKGRFCVLVGLRQGALQFWDIEENTLLASEEHYACTGLEWDPTGRYVVSCVSSWQTQTDTGVIMWNFTGSCISKQMIQGFKQFLWRPRPESLLSKEEMKTIRKNLKDFSREFDVEDAADLSKSSREVVEKRKAQLKEWKDLEAKWAAKYASEFDIRLKLYGFDPDKHLSENDDWVEV